MLVGRRAPILLKQLSQPVLRLTCIISAVRPGDAHRSRVARRQLNPACLLTPKGLRTPICHSMPGHNAS